MSILLKVEFHCHTFHSKDSLISPEKLVETCRRMGIDRVVVTDHNSIAGAREAWKLDPERVIVGEEIKTTRGEILAAFVTEEIPRGISPQEAIKRLRDQGAFISLSHPFDIMRESWSLPNLLEILPFLDAIEVFNGRAMWPNSNRRAQEFARLHNLPGTAGSDAHVAFELGRVALALPPFTGPDGLRAVIGQGRIEGRMSPFWVHFASRHASLRKKIRV
jgi:predicted metal-dependent phosphoesterase TrpH